MEPLTDDEVRQIVKAMPSKSCDLDAVPTSILKEALDLLLPTLVKLVNLSLVEGEFMQQWKTALVKPLLKSGYRADKYIISSSVKFTIPIKSSEECPPSCLIGTVMKTTSCQATSQPTGQIFHVRLHYLNELMISCGQWNIKK